MEQITEERMNELLWKERVYDALQSGGVDNWEWYGEAMSAVWDEDE